MLVCYCLPFFFFKKEIKVCTDLYMHKIISGMIDENRRKQCLPLGEKLPLASLIQATNGACDLKKSYADFYSHCKLSASMLFSR